MNIDIGRDLLLALGVMAMTLGLMFAPTSALYCFRLSFRRAFLPQSFLASKTYAA